MLALKWKARERKKMKNYWKCKHCGKVNYLDWEAEMSKEIEEAMNKFNKKLKRKIKTLTPKENK